MSAIIFGLILLIAGEISRRAYVKRLHEETLPSPYQVRQNRLLSLWIPFLPFGAISLLIGLISLVL